MCMHGYGTLGCQDGYQQSAVSIYRDRNCDISWGVCLIVKIGRRLGFNWISFLWAGTAWWGGGGFVAWFRDGCGERQWWRRTERSGPIWHWPVVKNRSYRWACQEQTFCSHCHSDKVGSWCLLRYNTSLDFGMFGVSGHAVSLYAARFLLSAIFLANTWLEEPLFNLWGKIFRWASVALMVCSFCPFCSHHWVPALPCWPAPAWLRRNCSGKKRTHGNGISLGSSVCPWVESHGNEIVVVIWSILDE